MNKVFLGSDHAGFTLKIALIESLKKELPNFEYLDFGCHDSQSVDYPDFAAKVAKEVGSGNGLGILVCGSGIGMCISANKVKGVRAASVWDATSARLCKEHNDANIICLGARLTGAEVALEAARTFLKTKFLAGRHANRVAKMQSLES